MYGKEGRMRKVQPQWLTGRRRERLNDSWRRAGKGRRESSRRADWLLRKISRFFRREVIFIGKIDILCPLKDDAWSTNFHCYLGTSDSLTLLLFRQDSCTTPKTIPKMMAYFKKSLLEMRIQRWGSQNQFFTAKKNDWIEDKTNPWQYVLPEIFIIHSCWRLRKSTAARLPWRPIWIVQYTCQDVTNSNRSKFNQLA